MNILSTQQLFDYRSVSGNQTSHKNNPESTTQVISNDAQSKANELKTSTVNVVNNVNDELRMKLDDKAKSSMGFEIVDGRPVVKYTDKEGKVIARIPSQLELENSKRLKNYLDRVMNDVTPKRVGSNIDLTA